MKRVLVELSAAMMLLFCGAALIAATALYVLWALAYSGIAFERGEPISLGSFGRDVAVDVVSQQLGGLT